MKLTKKMFKVMADLEYLIGSECYNPDSYDGWNDMMFSLSNKCSR